MIGLLVFLGLAALLAWGFWYGLRGEPNRPEEMGNNSPWPTSLSSELPPHLPTPLVESETEPEVHARLRPRVRRRRR